ncbi:NADP-dependent oxidoreductase domain-containing protein [Mycena maculata]|uniref:NADP-dependent oxidoreductase domain-containing protein n=1 Tax=Mycena maculata TaxID=230809 RepID=A0AAD7HRF0_9AGAR|nr:NADP-dependent oxidoreductase domain-containing protein [Mycena maculata]
MGSLPPNYMVAPEARRWKKISSARFSRNQPQSLDASITGVCDNFLTKQLKIIDRLPLVNDHLMILRTILTVRGACPPDQRRLASRPHPRRPSNLQLPTFPVCLKIAVAGGLVPNALHKSLGSDAAVAVHKQIFKIPGIVVLIGGRTGVETLILIRGRPDCASSASCTDESGLKQEDPDHFDWSAAHPGVVPAERAITEHSRPLAVALLLAPGPRRYDPINLFEAKSSGRRGSRLGRAASGATSAWPVHLFRPMGLSSRIPVIYGSGGIGAPGTFCKLTTARAAQPIIDAWCARCGPGAIDTSNLHGFGTCEKILAEMDLHGSCVDTKFYPLAAGDHTAEKLRAAYAKSFESLKGVKVRVLYLHALFPHSPDRATPWVETLKAIDELHKEGKFELFGLSNYKTYEVAEIVTLCRVNGWVAPSVYQGIYSAIDRTVETDLIPCLRHFGLKFAACCPLAGGYLVGHLLGADAKIPRGSHFDPRNPFGMWYQDRYLPMNAAVRELRDVVHHSMMLPTDLGLIFGGRKVSHIEETLQYCTEGPLPDPVVEAYEECYAKVRGRLPNYHHDPAWYDHEVSGY